MSQSSAENSHFRDGAKYVCRKCKKKFFSRDEVEQCYKANLAAELAAEASKKAEAEAKIEAEKKTEAAKKAEALKREAAEAKALDVNSAVSKGTPLKKTK